METDGNGSFDGENVQAFYSRQIPEVVKLIAASFLVAIVLHIFFRKKKQPSSSPLISYSLQGDAASSVGRGDYFGTVDASVEEKEEPLSRETNNVETKGKTRRKKAKPAKEASATRNYDKLIQKKDPHCGDEVGLKAKDATNSSPGQHAVSVSIPAPVAEAQQQPPPSPTPLRLHSQERHPGLSAYYNWHATITSLYRIYRIPSRNLSNNTFNPAILPMRPSSERGNIAVDITVVNQTSYESIQVYWIDYKGNGVYKGNIPRGGSWVQTTFIGHPWTFRVGGSDGGEESVLLKYVPFRITPNVPGVGSTTSQSSSFGLPNPVGMQTFTIRDVPQGYVTRDEGYEPACWVDDEILPEPPLVNTYNNGESNPWRNLSLFTAHEMQMAIEWSCFQLQREEAVSPGTGVAASKRLLQYLKNVSLHPDNAKYRKLRVANRIFFESVYSTGARGVLLALGFEEHMGSLECGPSDGALNYERLRQISDAMEIVDKTLKVMTESDAVVQPEGVDGYGRAGFGHAGAMNL